MSLMRLAYASEATFKAKPVETRCGAQRGPDLDGIPE